MAANVWLWRDIGLIHDAIMSNVFTLVDGSGPEFIYPIDNITVAAGRNALFTCVVNKLEGHKVMMK